MKFIQQFTSKRDRSIYDHFKHGKRQKWLSKHYELSVSRIKAIVGEQRRIEQQRGER